MPKSLKVWGVIIIGISVLLMVLSWQNDAPTNDEIAHIGAGYSYLVEHNMRLNPEHPPLVKDIAAVPLLFLNLKSDILFNAPIFWTGDIQAISQWGFGQILLYKLGNNPDQILHYTRLPMLLFFILAAFLIFKWGYELFGAKAGIISLVLFSFSPTVLAHGSLVTTDMAATASAILSIYFFLKYLKTPTRQNLLIASLVFGITASVKFSTLLLIPFFVIISILSGIFANLTRQDLVKQVLPGILVTIVGFILVVTPLYYFNIYNYNPQQQAKDTYIILNELFGENTFTKTVVWLSDKPVLRIYGNYMLGLGIITQRFSTGGDTYFLDELRKSVSISYFPILYMLKDPLPWLIILATALIFVFRKRNLENNAASKFLGWARNNFTQFTMLLWIVVYLVTSLNSNLKIGVRHLLPIYPFIILLVSGQISKVSEKLKTENRKLFSTFNFILLTLLVWYVIDAFAAFPNYISYYNEVAGGNANGYKYAVDSNLDWGQDLKRLGQWTKKNNIPKIELDYFGWADPKYYLGDKFIPTNSDEYKNAKDFQVRNQSNGWIAVSATTLFQRSYSAYGWLRPFQPTANIGNSIYVWHFN